MKSQWVFCQAHLMRLRTAGDTTFTLKKNSLEVVETVDKYDLKFNVTFGHFDEN